jgi:hypothetical protein
MGNPLRLPLRGSQRQQVMARVTVARDTSGRFLKGAKRSASAGRRLGTPNKVTREVKGFLAEVLSESDVQDAVRGRILAGDTRAFFKAYETVYGRPRQSIEVIGQQSWIWEPPARVDESVELRAGTLIFPQGSHIHEGGGEAHCLRCHENWAARIDEKLECQRCLLHPDERPDKGIR